jgi:hypothetical protein
VEGHHGSENYNFFMSCLDYTQAPVIVGAGGPSAFHRTQANKLYRKFLNLGAKQQVNVSDVCRRAVQAGLLDATPTLFDEARREIFKLLRLNYYAGFCASEAYLAAVEKRHASAADESAAADELSKKHEALVSTAPPLTAVLASGHPMHNSFVDAIFSASGVAHAYYHDLMFVHDVEVFRALPAQMGQQRAEQYIQKIAWKLYDKFLKLGARWPVKVSPTCRERIQRELHHPTYTMFDPAFDLVLQHLVQRAYPLYLASPAGAALVGASAAAAAAAASQSRPVTPAGGLVAAAGAPQTLTSRAAMVKRQMTSAVAGGIEVLRMGGGVAKRTFSRQSADFDQHGGEHAGDAPRRRGQSATERPHQGSDSEEFSEARPPPFMMILGAPAPCRIFKEFLGSVHCQENIMFWLDVEDYKRSPASAYFVKQASKIFNKYVRAGAKQEVNIPSDARAEVEAGLATAPPSLFNRAQLIIFKLMQNDLYPRFLKSPYLAEVLTEFKAQGGEKRHHQVSMRRLSIVAGDLDSDEFASFSKLEKVLAHPVACRHFKEFCEVSQCSENIHFYLEAEEIKHMPNTTYLRLRAQKTFNKFVKHDARMQVNISAVLRGEIEERMALPLLNNLIFNDAQREVFNLMTRDTFPRFRTSPNFAALRSVYVAAGSLSAIASQAQAELDKRKEVKDAERLAEVAEEGVGSQHA